MKARVVAVAFAAIVAACGSVAGSGGTPSPTPAAGTVMVTRASNQQTVRAHVGDHRARPVVVAGEHARGETWRGLPRRRRKQHETFQGLQLHERAGRKRLVE